MRGHSKIRGQNLLTNMLTLLVYSETTLITPHTNFLCTVHLGTIPTQLPFPFSEHFQHPVLLQFPKSHW